MRFLRIFLLYFQHITEYKSKAFVFFLLSLITPMVVLSFWIAALSSNRTTGIQLSDMTSYYFLLVVGGAFLTSHIEQAVAFDDIYQGHLTKYLLKPFSYFTINFFYEFPWRVLQGAFGVLTIFVFTVMFGSFISLPTEPSILTASILIALLGYLLSYTFKMLLGMIAFWTTDAFGIISLFELLALLLAGYLMPLSLYPQWLANIAYSTPLAYMLYFPVIAFQGKLNLSQLAGVIFQQLLWIAVFYFIYKFVWNRGIRRYTAFGQ